MSASLDEDRAPLAPEKRPMIEEEVEVKPRPRLLSCNFSTTTWACIAVGALLLVIQLEFFFVVGPERFSLDQFKGLWTSHTVPHNHGDSIWLQEYNHPGVLVEETGRAADVVDAFADFARIPSCNWSSLDLHAPFAPLCHDRTALLAAVTDGGRIGIDAPFSPRGCDMRWFNSDEICGILSRFETVFMVGDSMMRSLATALHVILRKDLVNGGRTSWQPDPDGIFCGCENGFMTSACGFHQAHGSSLVIENDPDSLYCPIESTARVDLNIQLAAPLNDSIDTLGSDLPKGKPKKPVAFVFGHGAWNGFNETLSKLWYAQVKEEIQDHMPWLQAPDAYFPRLFITPSAAGPNKPDQYLASQGNSAIMRFERNMRAWISDELEESVEHMGLYNMTVQNTSPDGTHAGLKANMIKAMMVLNWLNLLDTSSFQAP